MKTTQIFPNSLPVKEGLANKLLENERSHLIYLMPEFVECISTRENDLKEALQDVLNDIARMLVGDFSELKKLLDNNKS